MTDSPSGSILLYSPAAGQIKVQIRLQNETLWLTQKAMAELFGVQIPAISKHLKNIFDTGELLELATVSKMETVQFEGERQVLRSVDYFNLDAVIAVGYRVNSRQATQFRIWATRILRDYLTKGYVLDDESMKEEGHQRYFEELLARIRDIRSSEKVFWRKVLDIYATSIDYDPLADATKLFFKQIQNKMHWAAHGHTAAEVIHARVDADAPQLGLTNVPGTHILRRDVEIAKNYLHEEELTMLNRLVTAYLEVAEIQAMNQTPMTMREWSERMNGFLTMTGRPLLDHAGSIRHEDAISKAHAEFDRYQALHLEQPSEAELHFLAAEGELKAIEKSPAARRQQKRKS